MRAVVRFWIDEGMKVSKRVEAGKVACMSTINTTIRVGDDIAGIIAGLLSRFAKRQRVRAALTDQTNAPEQMPTLAEFSERIDAARQKMPPSSWTTADKALRDLREGERD